MHKPSKEDLKPSVDTARRRIVAQQNAIKKMYEDQRRQMETMTTCWADGTVEITSLLLFTAIEIKDMNFDCSSTVLEFNGTLPGVGVGYFKAYGAGAFDKGPDWLAGKTVKIELAVGGAGAAGVQLTFWYDGAIIGAFDAIGPGVGIAVGWGEGTFKRVG